MMKHTEQPSTRTPLGRAMLAVSARAFGKPVGHTPTVPQNNNDEHAVHFGVGGPGFNPEAGGHHAV